MTHIIRHIKIHLQKVRDAYDFSIYYFVKSLNRSINVVPLYSYMFKLKL